MIEGKFSNTATTDSLLKVSIIVDYDPTLSFYTDSKTQIILFLYEYGNKRVKSGVNEEFTVKILDTQDEIFETYGVLYQDRIYVGGYENNQKTIEHILNILKQKGTVSFYLSSNKYLKTYQFTLSDIGNFNEAYSSIVDIEEDNEEENNNTSNQTISTKKVQIKSGSNPNVRNAPSTDSNILGVAKSEKIYDLLELLGNWYKIRLDNGIEGWISGAMADIL